MKRGFNRAQRVGDLIQKSLAQILLTSMPDERFHLVTVTGVTLSRDLSYAKVYVSVLLEDKDEILKTMKALNRAAKHIRYQLAKDVILRIVPELKFIYDESTFRGFEISRLLDSALDKNNKE